MLISLHINNILLIAKANIKFASNLSVLTGETGAGKSIILDSLLFALGERANTKLIRQGELSANVSAEFSLENNNEIYEILEELDIKIDENLIIRRSVNSDGKSKNFVNDTPVSLITIKKLSERLIEIHSQHEQKFLLDSTSYIDIIDNFGNILSERKILNEYYNNFKEAQNNLFNLHSSIENFIKEQEYLNYVVEELTKLNVQAGEEEELSTKRLHLMNKEKLLEIINYSLTEIDGKNSLLNKVNDLQRFLTRNNNFPNFSFDIAIDSIDKASIELSDASSNLQQMLRSINNDEDLLDDIESRLFTLKAVARKYNVQVEELPNYLIDISTKLNAINNQEKFLLEAENNLKLKKELYIKQAFKLSDLRKKVAEQLELSIKKELVQLKMENTVFKILIEQVDEQQYSKNGIDKINFMISPNVGIPPSPIAKVASGGELSRFMLAAKVTLAKISNVRTLIFDEIDTGLGGAVADAVGVRLVELAKSTQVIAITHQPQIAAKGNTHIHISKKHDNALTTTNIKILTQDERIEEIARMLAGERITDAAREAAKHLLHNL